MAVDSKIQDLLEQIPRLAADGDASGLRDVWSKLNAASDSEERGPLAVAFAEALLPYPGARSVAIPPLTEVLGELSDADRIGWLLRGLHAAAQIQLAEGELDEAEGVIGALGALSKRADSPRYLFTAHILRAELLMTRGEIGSASSAFRDLIRRLDEHDDFEEKGPLKRYALTEWIGALAEIGAYREAKNRLETLNGDETPYLAFQRGVIERGLGNRQRAVVAFENAIELSQGYYDQAWTLESLIALADIDPDNADIHLDAACSLADQMDDPEASHRAELAQIHHLIETGAYGEARRRLDAVDGEDISALLMRAELGATTGHTGEAIPAVNTLLEETAGRGLRGVRARAHILAASLPGSIEERAKHIRTALDIFDDLQDQIGRAEALCQQGALQIELRDYDEAMETALQANDIATRLDQPDISAEAWLILARAAAALGREQEAEEHISRALQLAETHDLIPKRIRALSMAGDDEQARELAEEHGLKLKDVVS